MASLALCIVLYMQHTPSEPSFELVELYIHMLHLPAMEDELTYQRKAELKLAVHCVRCAGQTRAHKLKLVERLRGRSDGPRLGNCKRYTVDRYRFGCMRK